MTITDSPARAAGTRPPGRPLSTELSEQLVAVALDILADEGWGRLNSDRVAARARAGKAGIYRRWPTMAALARHALSTTALVEVPADSGSLSTDLCGLMLPWTRPLSRARIGSPPISALLLSAIACPSVTSAPSATEGA